MTFPVPLRTLFLLALALGAGLSAARAQGGPPMITDDPGTPGDKHWEINLGWTDQRTPGTTLYGLPLLDANYGVGERVELTYEAPWAIANDSDGTRSGMGDSLLGAKWRFYDAGDKGWQASVYPQVTFLTPGSNSDKRGLADSATTTLLPIEVARDFGDIQVNFDCGHIFAQKREDQGWMGGLILGKEIVKGWELDLETHFNTSESAGKVECIVNAGTRIDLSEHLTLMMALGRDVSNTLSPKASLMSYLGLQLRL